MKFEYYVDRNDLLQLFLYSANSSKTVKRARVKNKFIPSAVFLFLCILSVFRAGIYCSFLLFVFAILWFLLYPMYESKRYIRYYQDIITEKYLNSIGKKVVIEFLEDQLYLVEGQSESKIHFSEIVTIEEVSERYFIHLKGSGRFAIPKNKLEQKDGFDKAVKAFALKHSIPQSMDLMWEWR
jgi:hypothetical protein